VDDALQAQKVETRGDPRAISRSVVSILKKHLGRGPLKAKTYLHEDSVLVLMYNGHTQAEETLQEAHENKAVAANRVTASEAIREPLIAVIESETSRAVVGFMSSSQQEPSLLNLVFVLDSSDLIEEDALKA
jgi:uncharacterized protein YbcI